MRATPPPFGVSEKRDSVVAQAASLPDLSNAIDMKAGWQPALRRFAIREYAILIACLFCFFCALGATAHAQSRMPNPTPNYGQIDAVTPEKGLEILTDFRARGIEGDYYFEFQLRRRPRSSSETIVTPGRMWGSRNAQGPITRITLWPGVPGKELQLLIQNGPAGAIWSYGEKPVTSEATGSTNLKAESLKTEDKPASAQTTTPSSAFRLSGFQNFSSAAMFEPLAGTDLTPFELQMPFVYWNDFIYEGIKPAASNRPAYAFIMRPPSALAAAHPEVTGVRIYIETAFRAMGKFEILGAGDKVVKTMTLKETPRVNGQYIVGKVELRDEGTRDATDFQVKLAAVKLDLPRDIFSPENLSKPAAPPDAALMTNVK